MGRGRSTAFSQFPPLFGPYHRTELLVALQRAGPLRSAGLKEAFGGETGRSVKREKSNLAGLIVAVSTGHAYSGDLLGLNPELSSEPSFVNLLARIGAAHPLRELPSKPSPENMALFARTTFAPIKNYEAVFASEVRTRLLVALRVLGGSYSIGKLQRSVAHSFASRVRVAINGYIEEGVLVKNGLLIEFNPKLSWLPQLLEFLDFLSPKMPDVAIHARHQDDTRKTAKGTSHSHGTKFRIFGSRVNQAMLVYLAAFGPTRIMELCAETAGVNSRAIEPLIEQGLVCKIWSRGTSSQWVYSLNADHPTYAEVKALLRTQVVIADSLPLHRNRPLYDGEDYSESKGVYLPYEIFGVPGKAAVANILGMLLHTPHDEADVSSLTRLASEHNIQSITKALMRLERLGIIVSRQFKTLTLYRLDPAWPAYEQMRGLLKAMGRAWPEYAEGGAVEAALFSPNRVALERGRDVDGDRDWGRGSYGPSLG